MFTNVSAVLISQRLICLTFVLVGFLFCDSNNVSANSDILYSRYTNSNSQILDESRVCSDMNSASYICNDLTGQNYGSETMTVADFDNDGDTDLIATKSLPFGTTRICLNDGNGVFNCSVIPSSSGYANDSKAADFDEDGDIDVVISYGTQANKICLNNGEANFTCNPFGPIVQSAVRLGIGDFNNDNHIDVVVARQTYNGNSQGGYNAVCLGDGLGGLICQDITSEEYYTADVGVGDFNNDSHPDLFFVNMSGATNVDHSVCLNNGTGIFSCTPSGISTYNLTVDTGVSVADFNNDGYPDIALADQLNRTTGSRICYGDGQGQFVCSLSLNLGSVSQVDSGDIDNNGYIDLAYTSTNISTKNPVCYNSVNGFNCTFIDTDTGYNVDVTIADIKNYPAISNSTPDLNVIGHRAMPENQLLTFTTTATDPDNDPITYFATNLPAGATFVNEVFSWTPSYAQAGTYSITFTASDGTLSDSETVDIIVTNTNRAPIMLPIGNQTVVENHSLSFSLFAIDDDGDLITYSALNLPSGATFSGNNFSWTPTYAQAGNYENIEFTVSDSGLPMELDVELITISVGDVNRAPELSSPGPQSVLEQVPVSFTIIASDPDMDTVILTASNLPAGSGFNANTGVFTWIPSLSQSGVYTPTFTATDNGSPVESSSVDVVITIGDDPTPTEQAQTLINTVVSFNLPNNVMNSYMANLQKIEPFIANGQIQPALNQLDAFINKVNQDYSKNKITLEQKNQLILMAQALIADLQ